MRLEGQLVTLLPAHQDLCEAVSNYYNKNREFLSDFEPLRNEEFYTPRFQELALAEEEVLRLEERSYRYFIIERTHETEVIGTIALSNVVWKAFKSCFMGYALDESHRGRGYMTEAVGLLTRYAFDDLGLHRIEANVMPRNTASLKVLEKNGYVNEGLSRKYLNIKGVWEDHCHMVALNES